MASSGRTHGSIALEKLWQMPPDRHYPAEEVRRGLALIVAVLEGIPGVRAVEAEPVGQGGWDVQFQIDPTHPLAWDVVRHLTFAVNGYECANDDLALFGPVWDIGAACKGGSHAQIVWSIASQARRPDAAVYAEYLRDRLPPASTGPAGWSG